jgi:hypothetical protein
MSDEPRAQSRKPPPPPPRRPSPEAIAPTVTAPSEAVTQTLKDQITEMALDLLEEQVQARIVHYRADLETNPELDAITEHMVEQLRQMQASHATSTSPSEGSRAAIRASHEKTLTSLLERIFRVGAPSMLIETRLKAVHRRLARLFFESELHEKTRGNDGTSKVILHGEQAVFYLFARYHHRLKNELAGFEFASSDVHDRAEALLAQFTKEMQDAFLSRRSSELKRIVAVFNGLLVDFFCNHLPAMIPELSREVIEQSESFEGQAFAYKVSAEAFPRFRVAFERGFMVRLVSFAEDVLVARLADTAGTVRDETIQFITDPQIFSAICGELTGGLYDFLCNEGFLDVPKDWRATLS